VVIACGRGHSARRSRGGRASGYLGGTGHGPTGMLEIPGDRRWAILALLGVAQLMVILDSTIVNIALPSAQKSLTFLVTTVSGLSPLTPWRLAVFYS
jgi:hypothetical protein